MFHAARRRNKSKNTKTGVFHNQQPVVTNEGAGNKKNEKVLQPLRARNIQKQDNQPFQKKLLAKARQEEKENISFAEEETKATELPEYS